MRKNRLYCLVLFLMMLLPSYAGASSPFNIHFCSAEEAREYIGRMDGFVMGLNDFDLVSRLSGTGYEISREGYLRYAQDNVLEWSEQGKKAVLAAAERFGQRIDSLGLDLPFPEEIRLIAGNIGEEGGAVGYTRATEIYLSASYCEQSDEAWLDYLFAHEMFHVLTRNSPDFRRKMYSCIGFEIGDKEINADKGLLSMRISNPDVNNYDNWAYFNIGGTTRKCTIWLYSDKEYNGGRFFEYAKVGLLELDEEMNPVRNADGTPVIYSIEQASDFFDKVGNNTLYYLNAEEILADNFSAAVNYNGKDKDKDFKSPWLIDAILDVNSERQ